MPVDLANTESEAWFASYWQGGYEGADHINGRGIPLHMVAQTGHLKRIDEDYEQIARVGLRTVRESAGWRICEPRAGVYDFETVRLREQAARRHGIQILWTCAHYGAPLDVDYLNDNWIERFQDFCAALARALLEFQNPASLAPVFTPFNEISFLAWAVCETGLIAPYKGDAALSGWELKMRLVRASLLAARSIRSVQPRARMLWTDPLITVHATDDDVLLARLAAMQASYQFQAWDALLAEDPDNETTVRRDREMIGVNYYHSSQWEVETRRPVPWHLNDKRRRSLSDQLVDLAKRYPLPLCVSETSHVGDGRAIWLRDVAGQVCEAGNRGVPVAGICLYPILDRFDWEEPRHWHCSGLWDVDSFDHTLPRRLNRAYWHELSAQQKSWNHTNSLETLTMKTLVVFSHLRWDFVYQRPQHLLARLASDWRVVFVEEAVFDAQTTTLELMNPEPNVEVIRPHTTSPSGGFHNDVVDSIRSMLGAHLKAQAIEEYVLWFYTPMAMPIAIGLAPQAIIYDCMDELSAFMNAPAQLVDRENKLLKMSNLLFTGGPSLFESKRNKHAAAYCFPSSVDADHFGKAKNSAIAHPDMEGIAHPRLGFFGVIDERIDLPLIEALATRHPDWQICMVGPVVKIDPTTLPIQPNIHYFGQQSYNALPAFLASWDVCLLPFARNEATRFISPTKTLEYLAAGKPIVSTDIVDVASLYAGCVWIASNTDAFEADCQVALGGMTAEQHTAAAQVLDNTSWQRTVDAMNALLVKATREGINHEAQRYLSGNVSVPIHGPVKTKEPIECLILGAGPTGLSAAYHYGKGSVLLERNAKIGGWCRSINDGGFQFDYAGHIMFSNDPYVLELYELLLGDNLHWQNREAWVYSKNVFTRYPFQGALYGLPPDTLKECLLGAIEARYGASNATPVDTNSTRTPRLPIDEKDCCADGSVSEIVSHAKDDGICRTSKSEAAVDPATENFEQFIYRVWGAGVAKHFAIPYNRKLWTVPLSEMETSWLGGRVPLPNLEQMIDGALRPVAKPMGPNARFGYPLRGGFQALMDGFLPHLKGELRLDTAVRRVLPAESIVVMEDGTRLRYETLISTIPLPELIKAIGDAAPEEIHRAAAALEHVSIRCVNIGVARENVTDKHWIYYPEETIFHRIFVQGNASPHCNAPGGFGLTCEISYSPYKPLPVDGQALIQRCIDDCISVGMLRPDDRILVANSVDMPYAYVVYNHSRSANVALIRDWLTQFNIVLAGRYSEWEYYNSDHAFVAGKRAAERVRSGTHSATARIA